MSKRKAPAIIFGITQTELAEYRALQDQAKVIGDQLAQRRGGLIRRIEAQASAEPGLYRAQLNLREVHRFSANEVARILGQETADQVRAQLQPSIEKHLSVIEFT